MASEHLMIPYLAGASTAGGSQPDPNASLGGARSSSVAYSYQGQVTSVTDESVFADSSLIAHADVTGWWLSYHTAGSNVNAVRRVIAFDDSTGEVTLEGPLPALPVVTDYFRLWEPNGIFSSFDAADCSARSTSGRHRLLALRNQIGTFTVNLRAYVVPISPGPLECQIALSATSTLDFDCLSIATEDDEPDIRTTGITGVGERFAGNAFNRPQRFSSPRYLDQTYFTPAAFTANYDNNEARALWVKLHFVDTAPIPVAFESVWQVIWEDENGGSPPFSSGSLIIAVAVDGSDEEILANVDRAPRIAAGARVQANVTDRLSGLPVPDHTIAISQTAGSGTLGAQNKDTTDEDGDPVYRVYLSSTDPADEGDTVDFRIEVN